MRDPTSPRRTEPPGAFQPSTFKIILLKVPKIQGRNVF